MQSAFDQFIISIDRARDLIAVHNSVRSQSTKALDLSDILRAALVLAVSALDYYVHEVVRIGMLEIHRGQRSEPPAFSKFQISLGSAREALQTNLSLDSWLEDEIRQRHSFKSFQTPNNVADAIRLISDKSLWEEVSKRMGISSTEIKQRLSLIVDRRNKIAHEADIDPTLSIGGRWLIDEGLVSDAIDFIETVVKNIHAVI
jgi:hypothetical protein